tara:strand:+ start:180 stop:419 length:240 start_codon:yes stop_codon:yes gene_type:complete
VNLESEEKMRTDRKKDLDRYYNDHLKLQITRRLMMVKTWSEIMGIQSAVYEALSREEQAEQAELEQFEKWKKNQEKEKA